MRYEISWLAGIQQYARPTHQPMEIHSILAPVETRRGPPMNGNGPYVDFVLLLSLLIIIALCSVVFMRFLEIVGD